MKQIDCCLFSALGEIASRLNIGPGKYLVGQLSDEIIFGVSQSEGNITIPNVPNEPKANIVFDGGRNRKTHSRILSCNV